VKGSVLSGWPFSGQYQGRMAGGIRNGVAEAGSSI
jgi:hypothetical protein